MMQSRNWLTGRQPLGARMGPMRRRWLPAGLLLARLLGILVSLVASADPPSHEIAVPPDGPQGSHASLQSGEGTGQQELAREGVDPDASDGRLQVSKSDSSGVAVFRAPLHTAGRATTPTAAVDARQ